MIEFLITIAKLTDRAKFPFVHWDARQTEMPHSGICCWWGVSQLQYDDIWYCSFRWWYTHINGQFLHIFGIRITVQWVVLIQIAVHFILHISHGYCCFCEGFLLFLSFIKVQKTAVQICYSNILLYFPSFRCVCLYFCQRFFVHCFLLVFFVSSHPSTLSQTSEGSADNVSSKQLILIFYWETFDCIFWLSMTFRCLFTFLYLLISTDASIS